MAKPEDPSAVAGVAALPSRRARAAALLLLAVVALLPAAIAIPGLARSHDPIAVLIGRAFGLLAFGLMALQIAIGSRLRLLCGPIGVGQLLRVHRRAGLAVLALLLAHPLLVALGHGKPELLNPFRAPWPVLLGQAALAVLVVHSGLAVFRPRLGMDYTVWRRIHRAAFAIFALAFVHSFALGGALKRPVMAAVWVLVLVGVGALASHAHLLRPRALRRHRHLITAIVRETHDTTTVVLTPEAGQRFDFLPGQFMFLTPLRPDLPLEEHPFTISSSPTRPGVLSATIKSVGDFTASVQRWQNGEYVLVDGPHGTFSCLLHPRAERLVFVAGGVGITPLMSMLRFLRDTGDARAVRLCYANRTEADIIFRDELGRLETEMPLRVVHVLSQPSASWPGERGRISREFLGKLVEEEREAAYYVCGPPPMMESVVAGLRALRVPADRIHSEEFAL